MSETKSEATRDMFERLLDRLPGMVWASRIHPDGRNESVHLSDKLLAWSGLTREQALADPNKLNETIVPEDRERFERAFQKCLETLSPLDFLGRSRGADGVERWMHTSAVVERAEDGTLYVFGQSLDRTEEERTRRELIEAERSRAQSEATLQTVLDTLPVGVGVYDAEYKFVVYNKALTKLAGEAKQVTSEEIADAYGTFELDGVTPIPNSDLPLVRALGGEEVPGREMVLKLHGHHEPVVARFSGTPMRRPDGSVWAALVVGHDITVTRKLEDEVRARNAELMVSEEAKTSLIERLRFAIDELSTPVLEVWDDVLVTPIIGVIDSRRMADMVQKLLAEIVRTQAQYVIVDLTGVDLVDTKTADHLIKMVRKAELIGARCMLTGIQPAVAQTLVDIGVDFGRLTTLRNLKHGLRESLRLSRARGSERREAQAEVGEGRDAER